MSFLGSDLVRLIDEVLPSCFGGMPLDYQLAEEEIDGLPKVHIVISPRVGSLDAEAVIRTVVETLKTSPARAMMAERWKQADTLRVLRVEPYLTSSAKVQALHLMDGRRRLDGSRLSP